MNESSGLNPEIPEENSKRHSFDEINNGLDLNSSAINDDTGEFLRAVSHDLQAPLRRILQFTAIIQEDYAPVLDEEGKRILNIISDNAKTLENLITALTAFSRLGRQEMHFKDTDMGRLAQGVYGELAGREPDRSVKFTLNDMPQAWCDPLLLREVFSRLLDNARKFTSRSDNAEIEAGGKKSGNEIVYYIKDNGAGFNMNYVHKLFGIFQRLHTAGEYPGTGVGLAAVRQIVERHHGRVWAEGSPDGGAVFYFALPFRNT